MVSAVFLLRRSRGLWLPMKRHANNEYDIYFEDYFGGGVITNNAWNTVFTLNFIPSDINVERI